MKGFYRGVLTVALSLLPDVTSSV